MFEFVPESAILSLFDNVDDLTEYCIADNQQKAVIIRELVDRLIKEGKSVPGMVCNHTRRQ
jgi:hypothetical protein